MDWNLFVFDSAEVDPAELTRTLRRWLKTNYYYQGREWAYKDIPRRLIIERFIGPGGRRRRTSSSSASMACRKRSMYSGIGSPDPR